MQETSLCDNAAGVALVDLEELAPSGQLDEESLAAIDRRLAAAVTDPTSRIICFRGGPDRFLNGADREFFSRSLATGDLEPILRFTRQANQTLRRLERSPKRCVAWVAGTALGAGLELALACREIIAGPKARFRMPETSLGIVPGMGGTQRLPRRIGLGFAKWIIFTGSMAPAATAKQIGLVDRIVPHEASLDDVLAGSDSASGSVKLEPQWNALERFFAMNTIDQMLDQGFPQPDNSHLARAWLSLKQKPAVALRIAEQAIDRGFAVALEEGLAIEYASLRTVFSSTETLPLLSGR